MVTKPLVTKEDIRVNMHKNAKLTPRGREVMVRRVVIGGASYRQVAREFHVDPKTVSRWVTRFREAGSAALADRSSRPNQPRNQTPRAIRRRLVRLRERDRMTIEKLAQQEGVSRATVARILARAGLSRLSNLDPKPPVVRYEHRYPGSLVHLDIKKLGRFHRPGHRVTGRRGIQCRGAGWEYAHVAIDDHSRASWVDIQPDEKAASAWRSLLRVVRYFRSLGIHVERILTDNGMCYRSKAFARACRRLGIRHRFTKPYSPQTNGKAERFIQTALREWAYGHRYNTSQERTKHLYHWLHWYNWHRPHGSLGNNPPVSRLGLSGDNLLRLHT